MKPLNLVIALAITTLFESATPLLAGEKDVSGEPFGKLVLGQKSGEIIKLLGEPESKGKDTHWEAIGEWVQDWKFPAKGLSLAMASAKKDGARTLYSITASAGCQLSTARGLKIGSTEAEVLKAYAKVRDKEQSQPGESFIAGSVYGGVIFTFKKGKVSRIFVGAAAE